MAVRRILVAGDPDRLHVTIGKFETHVAPRIRDALSYDLVLEREALEAKLPSRPVPTEAREAQLYTIVYQ
jgi:hypothetical protein